MEEWEVCNDGGFIYKRRRRHVPPASPPSFHPHEDETQGRRSRRIAALSEVRDRYRHEVALWELLSDACRSMRENAEMERTRAQPIEALRFQEDSSVSGGTDMASLVDKLLFQAERREAVIRDLTQMCGYAESLCDAQEEQFKESLLELPIWGSPRRLMAALCDE